VYAELTLENITLTKGATPSNHIGGAGVYVNSGGTLIMQGSSTITNCKAGKGGGVHVSGGTFKMQDSAIVTPSTGSEQYTAGKNDVYLESGKTITVDDILSNNPAARITPQSYTENTPVLKGAITTSSPQNRKKFTVPPQKVTENSENWNVFWYVATDGTLKAEVEDLETLKEAIDAAPADDKPFIIKLAGTIDDLQTVQIPGNKKITLKADREVTLTCPSKGNDYKHLQVQNNASLTLEGQITLQGADSSYRKLHYALSVNHNGNAEIKRGVTITGCKNSNVTTTDGVEHSGKDPIVVDGTLTMSGGTIKENIVENDVTVWSGGGGVYIHAKWRNFTMTGGTIKGNTATEHGGGVYVDGSYNGGYPIRGQFTMLGGTITGNTAEINGKAVFVHHGDFTWTSGQITANTGNGAAVATELSGTVTNNTSPHQEPS